MREKLMELVDEARFMTIGEIADYLIANGVTIRVKKEKPPTDLTNKCGSCEYAKPTNEFGKSKCYVCCTNEDKWWRHRTSMYRQRTTPACKRYKAKENNDG